MISDTGKHNSIVSIIVFLVSIQIIVCGLILTEPMTYKFGMNSETDWKVIILYIVELPILLSMISSYIAIKKYNFTSKIKKLSMKRIVANIINYLIIISIIIYHIILIILIFKYII